MGAQLGGNADVSLDKNINSSVEENLLVRWKKRVPRVVFVEEVKLAPFAPIRKLVSDPAAAIGHVKIRPLIERTAYRRNGCIEIAGQYCGHALRRRPLFFNSLESGIFRKRDERHEKQHEH